jgi:hypothetical protein
VYVLFALLLEKGSLEFPNVSENSFGFPKLFSDVKYHLKTITFNIEQKNSKKIFWILFVNGMYRD